MEPFVQEQKGCVGVSSTQSFLFYQINHQPRVGGFCYNYIPGLPHESKFSNLKLQKAGKALSEEHLKTQKTTSEQEELWEIFNLLYGLW